MKPFSHFRSPRTWRGLGVVILISGTVIAASMGLTSFRNRHRAATQAVGWAFDALHTIPADTVALVYAPAAFTAAVDAYRQLVEDNTISVDSVRTFYHAYALMARDGAFTPQEVADLGPYLGLPSVNVQVRAAADSLLDGPVSVDRQPGE